MVVNLSNIIFSYSNTHNDEVLNIPSWCLSMNEHSLIYGASGSGKSTFLSILSGLLVPSEGSIIIHGQTLKGMNSRQRDRFRAENIGYVFQQFNLIPYLNAVENIQLARYFCSSIKASLIDSEIKILLESLNFEKKYWFKPTKNLSIGQQQRVAIARALINKPKLLLADEPTSALDEKNRISFMEILFSIVAVNPMTLVFVSHDKTLSSFFKRVESLSEINRLKG